MTKNLVPRRRILTVFSTLLVFAGYFQALPIQLAAQSFFSRLVANRANNVRASFSCTTSFPTEGQAIQFIDTSSGTPTSWQWNFGDGTTSTAQNPSHAYVKAGFKKIILIASNSRSSKRTTRTMTVMPVPAAASFVYSPASPAAGQDVQFADTTSGDPTSWLWDFGDGATSTAKNPRHAFASPSTYLVTLIASNSSGSNKATQSITVASVTSLVASFANNPSSPTAGQAVQFTDTSTGSPTSWQWNFGDGATSTEQSPSHTYATAGSKTVTLTATNSSGSNSVSRTVTVGAALTASFTYSPGSPTTGQSIAFTDTSTGSPTSWQWNFGDGSSSTTRNPNHTYTTAGAKTVTLTATNSTGSNSLSRTVTVVATLTASFTYSPGSPTTGQSIMFTDTSTGSPTAWQWNFGDGTTSTVQNPSRTYTTAGSKTVTLTVTNSSGSNTVTRTVTVAAALTASFTYSPASPATGQAVSFTDTSMGSPTSWQWSFGDGSSSTTRNPSHTYTTAGSKTVTLTATNSTGSNSVSRTVMVVAALTASFTYSPASPATGQAVQFTDTSTGNPTSWQWNFGDGTTSTAQNPSRIYTTAGSKTVTLTVTNSSGSNTATRTVSVSPALTASFTYSPASPTTGQAVQFTDTSTGSPSIWQWNFNDGTTSSAHNPSHAFASAGTYNVTLTIMNASGQDDINQIITVASVGTLTASFAYSPALPAPGQAVVFTDTSTGTPTSWRWNFGDGGSSTSRNPSHTYATAGSYPVTLIVGNASGSSTVNRTVAVAASDFLSADRLIDWTYTGIPGGIPNRTTIYRTLTSTASAADINAAIAACPSGQIVYLSAGTYNIGQISFGSKSGVTLRGAGPGKTIINTTASTAIANTYLAFSESAGIALEVGGGHTKGSMTITIASSPATYFIPGNLLIITQDDSPDAFDPGRGVYHRSGLTTAPYSLSPERSLRHTARIVSVSGNVIALATPLPWTFTDSLNPKAYALVGTGITSLCGVEDMTINGGGTADRAFSFSSADRCWIKNVEAYRFVGTTGIVFFGRSVQCEVRRCYIHDAPGWPTQSDGYGIMLYYGTDNCLVEDNIGYHLANLSIMNGASGNAYLYNYVLDTGRASTTNVGGGINCNHGPHGIMNLFEGNIMPKFANDGYHGSTSHSTIFRNSINGLNSDTDNNRRLVNLCRGSYYHNVVGNTIGDPSWAAYYYELTGTNAGYPTNWSIYALGYPGSDTSGMSPYTSVPWDNWSKPIDQPDADVSATLIRHGNYDYYNNGAVWDNNIVSHTIPNSLVYASKPDYFGSLQWPPIGPDVNGFVSDIPAKARWNAFVISGNLNDLF